MSTINQLIKSVIWTKKKWNLKTPALGFNNPQKEGTCLKTFTQTPRKPNSAKWKVARVKLTNDKIVTAYIPGEGHKLREYSVVLMRGGGVKDLPGVKYHLMRGLWDFEPVIGRTSAWSKYGVKRKA